MITSRQAGRKTEREGVIMTCWGFIGFCHEKKEKTALAAPATVSDSAVGIIWEEAE